MSVPLLVSYAFALSLIVVALKWPRVARAFIGLGFVAASCFNVVTVLRDPQAYVEGFGPLAIALYQRFIYGPFAQNPGLFVLPIAVGQLAVGVLVLSRTSRAVQIGLAGGILFLLAITPLGLGSAFPSPLLLAVALALLVRRSPQGVVS